MIAQIGMGTGALAVVGGTVAIVAFVTVSGASLVAIQGFASLGNIGVGVFTGFFAALVNVRIAAPVVTGIALAATVGAGATAELGAMRISEEIDALEVMGIKSIAFLASTRIIAASVVILPLYGHGDGHGVLVAPACHHGAVRAVKRHLQPLLPNIPATRRRVLVVRRGRRHRASS